MAFLLRLVLQILQVLLFGEQQKQQQQKRQQGNEFVFYLGYQNIKKKKKYANATESLLISNLTLRVTFCIKKFQIRHLKRC